jgi:hypothetical protein
MSERQITSMTEQIRELPGLAEYGSAVEVLKLLCDVTGCGCSMCLVMESIRSPTWPSPSMLLRRRYLSIWPNLASVGWFSPDETGIGSSTES